MRAKFPAIVVAVVVALTGCGSSGTPGEAPETSSAPEDDSSLVIYVGRNEDHVRPLVEAFENETDIRVDARYGSTGALATTILQEGENSPADLFFTQDPVYIGSLAEEGLLAALPADILGRVPEGLTGEDGEWVGVTARRRVLVHNPTIVSEDDLADTIEELTGAEWRGRLGIAPTHSSFVSFVAAMVAIEGEPETLGWLESIAANDPVVFNGNQEIVEAVAAGDLAAGLVNHYYVHRMKAEQGQVDAVNHSFLEGDPGDVLMPTTIGMLESSTRKPAALDFIRFLLTETSQKHFLGEVFEYPLVDGIGTPPGERALDPKVIRGMKLGEVPDSLQIATSLIARAGLI